MELFKQIPHARPVVVCVSKFLLFFNLSRHLTAKYCGVHTVTSLGSGDGKILGHTSEGNIGTIFPGGTFSNNAMEIIHFEI